jgi:protein TonB
MTARIPLYEFMPYGAPELLESARHHMLRAQMLSSLLAVTCFAALAMLGLRLQAPPAPMPIPDRQIFDFPPAYVPLPPMPSVPVAPPAAALDAGVPVPAPDQLVTSERILPSQEDLANLPSSRTGEGVGQVVIPQQGVEELLPKRGDVVPTDELPAPVREVRPRYPEMAQAAAIEGRVVVHVLVGRDGRVIKVEVDPKHTVPLLEGAALEAARQWVFKPAFTDNKPVAVWVALTFNFVLRE